MAADVFYFKHFVIHQGQSAMKVGTDSILLGSYVDTSSAGTILDIGTGSGLLAIMMAQKSKAHIDAVEIEPNAFSDACLNINRCSWHHRMMAYNLPVQEFFRAEKDRYDIIISNPPYFHSPGTTQLQAKNQAAERTTARTTETLSFEELTRSVSRLLLPEGKFYVIVPTDRAEQMLNAAAKHSLYLQDKLAISSYLDSPPIRYILGFGFNKLTPKEHSMHIYDEGTKYSKAFIELTKDFYAKDFS